jgi:hypothetical protein
VSTGRVACSDNSEIFTFPEDQRFREGWGIFRKVSNVHSKRRFTHKEISEFY